MTKKSKALAKRHVKKPSAALAKPTLGQVVDEVQQQRADLRRMMQASSLAAAFCAELAGMLKMPFSGTPEDTTNSAACWRYNSPRSSMRPNSTTSSVS